MQVFFVFCALAVAAVVMYVLHTYTDVFSEEQRKNRQYKRPGRDELFTRRCGLLGEISLLSPG